MTGTVQLPHAVSQDKPSKASCIHQNLQASSRTVHKLSPTRLETIADDVHLQQTGNMEQAKPLLPTELPDPSPVPKEDLPRVFTVTTSLKELVPSLF